MKRVEELTKDLMEFRTVQGNDEEFERCLDYIEDQFDSGFEFRRFESEGERSLLITAEDPEILLHGHIDVVEAEKEMFTPVKRNCKIYGRGSADMKSGIACLMKVLNGADRSDTGLLLTSDEERGGFNGTGHVIEEADLHPGFVISAEPDDSGSFPSIVVEQKGVLQLEITSEGRSAHSSKPEKGVNAAEKLLEKYSEIRRLFNHERDFPTTVNLGKMSSESPVNKIPSSASIQLDIRFSGEYTGDEVLEDLQEIEGINVEVLKRAPMLRTSDNEDYVRSLGESVEKVSGRTRFRRESFASDMRFFTEKGVPAVCFGPEGYGLHGEDEYVEIESLEEYCQILEDFLERCPE